MPLCFFKIVSCLSTNTFFAEKPNKLMCLIALSLLSACASTGVVIREVETVTEAVIEPAADQLLSDAEAAAEQEFDPDLPLLELGAQSLEQLLISNLASYQGKWDLASQSALKTAKSSQDYRLARLATLLALRARDYTTAADGATLWVTLQSDSEDANNMLVLSQTGAGRVDDVLATLEKQRGDLTIDAHIRKVAGLLVRQSNGDAAFDVVSAYVKQHPDSAQVMVSSAYVAETFGHPVEATEWVENAIRLRPSWDLAAQMKAGLLRRQGKVEERAQFIEKYVTNHPASVNMRISHAAELARQERYQEALDLMQASLVDEPNNVSALSYAAALSEQLKDVAQAKKYYAKALRYDIRNDEARWALARIAVSEKKYAKAEELFEDITSTERYFLAQVQVANMRFHTSGIKEAINTLATIRPSTEAEYIEIALTRHYLLMQAHQYERALGFINESIIYLTENVDLRYARALVAAELGKLEIAEADFRKVIQTQPDHANALNALGYTLADQTDRYDEARELIAKALELRPNDAHILDSMGWVAYRQNDIDVAIDFLQQAFAISPEIEIAAHLGEVLWESGHQEKAKEIWQNSYQEDAQNPVLNKTLQRYGVTFSDSEASLD